MSATSRVRRLHYSDNLPVLRNMQSECVDLIYLDPPFNSNRAYNIIYPDDLGQVTAFDDTWFWDTHCDHHLKGLFASELKAGRLLRAMVDAMGKVQMCAYLVNMAVRLVEMKRVLKPTGSIYLHCDDTASHYLKILMDSVFGPECFLNDISWRRSTSHNDAGRYGRILDHILFYGAGGDTYWAGEEIATPRTESALQSSYGMKDDRGRYRSGDLTGPLHSTRQGNPSTTPWRDYDVHAMGRCWSVPKTGKYAKWIDCRVIPGYLAIESIHERLDALDAANMIHHPTSGKWPGLKRYADADSGTMPQNLILEPTGFTNYNARRGGGVSFSATQLKSH